MNNGQPSDFSMLAGMYPQGEQGLSSSEAQAPGPDPMAENTKALGEFGASQAAAAAQNEPAFKLPPGVKRMTLSENGMDFHGVDPRMFEGLMSSQKKLNEIMGSFHQEAERLQNQEASLSTTGGRIGNAVSVLAGNLANQKDMPGWVRGLGQTSKDLNPTIDEVRARRLGILGHEAQIAEKQMSVEGMIAARRGASEQKLAEARTKGQDAFMRTYDNAARINQVVPSEEAFVKAAVGSGRFSEDEAHERYAAMASTAGTAANRWLEKKTQDEAIKVGGQKELIKLKTDGVTNRDQRLHGYRQAEIEQRLQGSIQKLGMAQEFNSSLAEYKKSIAEDKGLASVDKKQKERLIDLKGIERYAASTRDLLDMPEMKGYEGPLTPERLLPRFAQSPNLVKYNEWVNQELPRINSMIKGGVRMISSEQGRDFVKGKLGFTENMTADQIRGVLDNTDTIVNNERMNIVDGTPSPKAWKRYPALLGKAYDYAMTAGDGADEPARPAPTASGPRPGAKDSGGPHQKATGNDAMPSDPGFKAAIGKLPPGKAIKVGGKLYTKGQNGEPVEVQ